MNAKIGMLLDAEFPPDIRVENEMRTLAEAGNDVHLLCYDFAGKKSPLEKFTDRITIHRLRIYKQFHKKLNPLALILPFYFSYWSKHAFRFVEKYKLEVVHVHDLRLAEVGSRIKDRFHIPYILDLHENWPAGLKVYAFANSIAGKLIISLKSWDHYERQQISKPDALITVIEEMKERIVNLGLNEEKIFVVPNYLNSGLFDSGKINAEISKQPNEISLIYVGGFDAHRGLETLVVAMKIIQSNNDNIALHLIGSGSTEAKLKKIVQKKNISKVIFHGWQQDKKLPSYLSTCDIGIVPHLKNSQTDYTIPHKLFQYMYYGKPVIVSNCRPLNRIITETKSGLIFESGNARELATAIKKLAENKKLRINMGQRGRKAVINKYHWKIASRELFRLYEAIESTRSSE